VVLLSLDTVRADHLGCYGYARPTSPRLDAFAAGATRYSRSLASASWTLPTHASLFTGRYAFEHGAHGLRSTEPTRSLRPLDPAAVTLAEALRDLFAAEPRASVGVIARYPGQAALIHAGLRSAEVPNLRLVADADFTFRPGVDVTDIRQVKGLEYDYVVLVDVNASTYPTDPESRHLLHIGATRAAHQLWIVSTSAPSLLIPDWLR